jgi:hypothetical protein
MPFGASLLMRITGVWPTVSRMLANFAIGSSSVLTCLPDDIGHKASVPTGVPRVGRLRSMQSRVARMDLRSRTDKNLSAASEINQPASIVRREKGCA